jgi:hypothetical protein
VKQNIKDAFKAFSIELPIYAILVVAYVLLVLHFLGGWLFELFSANRKIYAGVALFLIIGQGFILELVSRGLLAVVNRKRKKAK